MMPVLTAIGLVWAWYTGATITALALLAAGLTVQVMLVARLLRSTLRGSGGHVEWLHAIGVRPRLARSPAWAIRSEERRVGKECRL